MRLVINNAENMDSPLLVDVFDYIDQNNFGFDVVNGHWAGRFDNGKLVIKNGRILTNAIITHQDSPELHGNNRDDYNGILNNLRKE